MQTTRMTRHHAFAFCVLSVSLWFSEASPWVISTAHAQQTPQGASKGQGSGGNTEGIAAPQGLGSGGTTAGALTGAGSSSGTSSGPGPVKQNRYGGRVAMAPVPPLPADGDAPGADTPTSSTSTALTIIDGSDSGSGGEAYVMGRGGRCGDYELGRMTVAQRIAGANLERLAAVETYLAAQRVGDGRKTPMYILANYQQELEQAEPSLALAGTYLGLVAIRRITPQVVIDVNNILCLATAAAQAEAIAQSAETQRLVVR